MEREKEFIKTNTFKPIINNKFFKRKNDSENNAKNGSMKRNISKSVNKTFGHTSRDNSFTFNRNFYKGSNHKNKKNETVMASLLLEENSLSNRSSNNYNASFISKDNNLVKYISNSNSEAKNNSIIDKDSMKITNKKINVTSSNKYRKNSYNDKKYMKYTKFNKQNDEMSTNQNYQKNTLKNKRKSKIVDTLEQNKEKIIKLLINDQDKNMNIDDAITKIAEELILSGIIIEKEKNNSELKKEEILEIINNFIIKLKATTTLDLNSYDQKSNKVKSLVYSNKNLSKSVVSLYSKSKEKLNKISNNSQEKNNSESDLIHLRKSPSFKHKNEMVDYILKRKLQQINQKISKDL